jgi:hypothetical protein
VQTGLHFEAFYVSWIYVSDKYYMRNVGQDLRRKADSAVSNSVQVHSFIVAASQIGLELGLITKATDAALIAAGLLSVLIFLIMALTILRRSEKSEGT